MSARGDLYRSLLGVEPAAIAAAAAAPAVVVVRTETQRVGCPYCPVAVGYCTITAEFRGGQMQIRGFHDPHKCEVCGRFFKLVPVVEVRGEWIPGE